MTTTDTTTTTDDREVIVVPEVRMRAGVATLAAEVRAEAERLRPALEALHARAVQVRAEHDRIVAEIAACTGEADDGLHDLAGRATGWDDLYTVLSGFGDLFSDERYGLGSGPGEGAES